MSLTWLPRDEWPWATAAAVSAILGAVALALFGLPSLDLHSPLHYAGIMDPLCGMTRAVRSLALGRFSEAWRFNPGSFLLLFVIAAVVLRAIFGVVTHRWVNIVVTHRAPVAVAMAVLAAVLWVNQQLHASLLMS